MAASAAAFLDLLAREAPAVEFERPALEARAAGAPAEVIDELERARGVALRVRALLERRSRREAELTALVDTVADLAMLHDLDAVLEAIVRRARKLLNADVAYMTLQDDQRGDTYMRVTDGSVSARFQQLRLPLGTGLGGLVAQTARPYVTPDYPHDSRFQHSTEIDTAVAEEGIVAILGVPMRLGARIVGVLFAANRSARPFARDDVTLLLSLAAHAAVAIDNARLLEETRAALAELSAANRVSQEHSEAVERAAEAHDRMADLVLRGGDVTDLAASVVELLGGALAVVDVDGRCLASVGDVGPSAAYAEAVTAARGLGRTVQRGEWWATSVNAGGEALCGLALRPAGQLADADLRIFERAAVVTALLLLSRRSVADAESRVRGELLDDLCSPARLDLRSAPSAMWAGEDVARPAQDEDTLRERARRLGVDLAEAHVALVLNGAPELRRRITTWAAGHAAHHSGLAAYRDGVGVLLLPGDDPGALARRAAREVRLAVGAAVTVGAAGPVRLPGEVVDAYRTAQRCAAALLALGRAGDGASPADLGFVGLLIGSGEGIDGYVTATLGPVLDYDQRRGTALCQTLDAYFGAGCSPARAAEVLHVHVNTVTQRLERLTTLLGEGWQRPERALELQLALRLHRLRIS